MKCGISTSLQRSISILAGCQLAWIDITQIVEEDAPTVTVTGFPTPGLVGAAYSGTLTMRPCGPIPSIALPADGWLRLVGSVAGGSYFSVSIPASLIDDLTEGRCWDSAETQGPNAVKFAAAAGDAPATVSFGHDASGNILIA